MYTKEVLENRLNELDDMFVELSALEQGFVGTLEEAEIAKIQEQYGYDSDSWFSDPSEIESVLGDLERLA